MSRSRKKVTRVMPNPIITRCTSLRGSVPKRLTVDLPWRVAELVLADRQGLEREVVVAERGDVEALHPVADPVPVRAVVDDDERRLLIDDLLDLAVERLPVGRVQLEPGLIHQLAGQAAAPVAVEGVGTALAVGAERRDLIGVADVVRPVPLAHLGVPAILLRVRGE